ncbi:MAG: hypothetical protein KDC85_09995 [Saprospiraceae bacterium]|nr:hypothetical protein [Saprospiraceae bacterium]MCB9323283.1 septum formation inhibitor Maf [Lewinellaceae bacterium]
MKNLILWGSLLIAIIGVLAYTNSNSSNTPVVKVEETDPIATQETSSEFNQYWYAGDAEITSYELEQARYGEMHSGKAVLIFVTEPFSRDKQVKTDNPGKTDVSVMKLNFTKNFNTGIYPYSMMNSSFVPVKEKNGHALKITSSSQDWCGHTYTQLNDRNGKFEIESHSYFEGEGDESFTLSKTILEDELWTRIRLNPEDLPVGAQEVIPSFFHLRLLHQALKPYSVRIEKKSLADNQTAYILKYPDLNRQLKIVYNNTFPYEITGWEETFTSGWGASAKTLTTKATKIKTIKTDYWTKHNNEDLPLRDELGL